MIYELHARYDRLPEPRRFWIGMALILSPLTVAMLSNVRLTWRLVGLLVLLVLLFSRIWYLRTDEVSASTQGHKGPAQRREYADRSDNRLEATKSEARRSTRQRNGDFESRKS